MLLGPWRNASPGIRVTMSDSRSLRVIALGEKAHTVVNEHEKVQSWTYLASLMPNLLYVTQIDP